MAEWSMAAVLKTVDRKVRGFESCSLRQFIIQDSPGSTKPVRNSGFFLAGIVSVAVVM